MTLDKNKTIAEIGRRTRLRNHNVQKMLEALVEVWSEALVQEERIEISSCWKSSAPIAVTKPEHCLWAENYVALCASSRN